MTILMDDPTTYLKRDKDVNCIALGMTTPLIQAYCRQYGVSIQVVVPGTASGIQAVTTIAKATDAIANYPPSTPWFIIDSRPPDRRVEMMLRAYFGPPKLAPVALGVVTEGVAWRPDRMIV